MITRFRVVTSTVLAAVVATLWTQFVQAAATNVLAIHVAREITTNTRAGSLCTRRPVELTIETMVFAPNVARLRATELLCANRPAEAELTLSEIAGGTDRLLLFVRGVARLELGHTGPALADLTAAGAAPYFLNRALQLEALGRVPEAVQQADLALQIDPAHVPALVASARMYASEGLWDTALQRLETAANIRDAGLQPAFWRDLGYATYQVTADRHSAAGYFQRAIDQDPGDPQTFILVADLDIRSGDYVSGRVALERAVALAPDDDATLVAAAKLYINAGQPALVQHWLETRIARANGQVFGEVYFYLGLALEQLHLEQSALDAYMAAHDRYPSDSRWSREVARVRSLLSE